MRELVVRTKWISAQRRPRPVRIVRFHFNGIASLGKGSLTLLPFLTLITGGNGTGKTTVLRALAAASLSEDEVPSESLRILAGSTLSLVVSIDNEEVTYTTSIRGDGTIQRDWPAENLPLPVVMVDLERRVRWVQQWSAVEGRVREELQAYTPRELEKAEIAAISRIAGKSYRRITLFEVEGDDDTTFAYFVVEEDCPAATLYGSDAMGTGEVRIFILWWALDRAESGSLIIVDEPDASLSEGSQSALIDLMAIQGADAGKMFVLTSHASKTISLSPTQSLRLLTRENGQVSILDPATPAQAASVLGVSRRASALMLCEDVVASEILHELLGSSALDLSANIEVVVVGSEAKIRKHVDEFPKTKNSIAFIGAYDGGIAAAAGQNWPVISLPGNVAPEFWIRKLAVDAPDRLAALLGRDATTVRVALAAADGRDLHDWLYEFATPAKSSWQEVVRAAVRLWIETNSEDYGVFCGSVVAVLAASTR